MDIIRYSPVEKIWYIWDGKRWKKDEVGKIVRLAKGVIRQRGTEVILSDDPDKGKKLKAILQSEEVNRIKGMITLTQSEVPVIPNQLDTNPRIFNVQG